MAKTKLAADFKEFLQLLNSKRIKYLLIGGYAVGYYGYPRYTGDIDVWVERTEENAERLVEALASFGFEVDSQTKELALKEKQIFRMGFAPLRIEVLTTISGVDFDACYSSRGVANIDGFEIPVISLEDLLTNKRATGRHKDLEDVTRLERVRKSAQ